MLPGRIFDALVRRVAEGERLVITESGRPVVKMVPVATCSNLEGGSKRRLPMTLEALKEWRKSHKRTIQDFLNGGGF